MLHICRFKQGPCKWCGKRGMCCSEKGKFRWRGFEKKCIYENGCDGTFGGKTDYLWDFECSIKNISFSQLYKYLLKLNVISNISYIEKGYI